jgi:hypothetical protein
MGATQALVDDQSAATGTGIAFSPTFTPAGCGGKGTWFDYNSGTGATMGTITPAQGSFVFSAAPSLDGGVTPAVDAGTDAGSASDGATDAPVESGRADAAPDTGARDGASDAAAEGGGSVDTGASDSSAAVDSAGSDSGGATITGAKAACIMGTTGSTQYNTSGLGLNLATIPNDAGSTNPVPVNVSSYTGLQFMIWGGGTTNQNVIVQLADKQETMGLGICDNTVTGHECGGATKPIVVTPGWQTVQIPFALFLINMNYGQLNESVVDPTSAAQIQWQIQEPVADAGSGVPFNFCVTNVTFY